MKDLFIALHETNKRRGIEIEQYPYKILEDCKRSISILYYLTRKTYVENLKDKRDAIKNLLRAIRFANLFNFDYTFSIEETIKTFRKNYKLSKEIEKIALLPYKKKRRITKKILEEALRFLDNLDFAISQKMEEIENVLKGRYWYHYEGKIKFFHYKGIENRNILYLPGLPRYPPEEVLKNFRLLGNVYVIDYVHLIREGIKFDKVVKLLERFNFDIAICESFGSILGFHLASSMKNKKFIFLSPVLSFSKIKKLRDEVLSLFDVLKKLYSLKEEHRSIYNSIFKLDPIKIKKKDLANSIAFYSVNDEKYIKGLEKFKMKKIKSKEKHGYKMLRDFKVWKALLNFVNFKPFIKL